MSSDMEHKAEQQIEAGLSERDELLRKIEDLEKIKRLYFVLIEEWNEGCEADCSKYGHSNDCAMVDLGVAKRKLREQIEQQDNELKSMALKSYDDNFKIIELSKKVAIAVEELTALKNNYSFANGAVYDDIDKAIRRITNDSR